jgi:structural maintenance of chromosome 4
MSREKVEAGLAVLETQKKALSGAVNIGAIKEFRAKEKEYLKRVAVLAGISDAREHARREYEGARAARLDAFMAGFSTITLRLKEMYQMITLGGDAELELVDSLDPFAEGIVFSVRPPKKSWKNISNLSGGEKTLSSLALVFALHHYAPTPLYVMDEIDAALDFKNVSIVAHYIKERTRDAQFVIISLRNNMFELADRLVGIYKTADVTKSVTRRSVHEHTRHKRRMIVVIGPGDVVGFRLEREKVMRYLPIESLFDEAVAMEKHG